MTQTKVEIQELLEAGAHFGHKIEKWNPKMKPFIFTKKSGIHIIDLTKTKEELEKALEFISKAIGEGKNILFVGTKKQAQENVKSEAERAGMPYVSERWLGGTLTNFQTVIKQVKKLKSLRGEKEKGDWEKFSKKEKAVKQKELEKLEKSIGGLENLKDLPDIMYIIDTAKEHLAVKEAKKMGIPIVGVVDSNADPTIIDYPIPSNDDAVKVIKLINLKVADQILKAKPVEPKEEEVKEEEGAKKEEKLLKVKEEIEEIEEKLEEEKDEEEIESKKRIKKETA